MNFRIFQKKQTQSKPPKKHDAVRRFVGAKNSAMNKFDTSYARINAELKSDYIALTLRARDLSKNNEIVNSYINLMIRNVIGNIGFQLNVTAYNDDGTADTIANNLIETAWYDYAKSFKKWVSADEQMNDIDFDKYILFNLLVDGEVFIHRVKDNTSKYGIRYELIDSLDVDTLFNYDRADENGEKICMGIKVDKHYKPVSYFIRKHKSTDYYLSGEREEIPASEIIHLFRRQYVNQVRGFTPLAPVIQCLNGLEQYKNAEINASLLNSCYMGVWEKTSAAANSFDEYDESEVDDKGDVAVEVEQNVFRYAPDGYHLQSIQSQHPNNNMGAFFKACIKGIASALGVSSNKLNSDYESVNYSSLRQANSEDINAWKELQQFMIDNWKNLQYAEWLKYLLLSDLTNLPYSKIDKFIVHDFKGRSWEYLDPVKEYSAIKLKLEMKLTNPIIEIEKQGLDVDDVLNGWELWNSKLADRKLTVNQDELTNEIVKTAVLNQIADVDDSVNENE